MSDNKEFSKSESPSTSMVVADLDLASSVVCSDELLATKVANTQNNDVSEVLPRLPTFK